VNLLCSLFVRWSSRGGRPFLISLLDEIVEDVGEGAGGGRWQMVMVGGCDDGLSILVLHTKGVSPCHVDREAVRFQHSTRQIHVAPSALCLVITPRSGSFQNDRRVVEDGLSDTKSQPRLSPST
jgi:hypothetical protein